MNKLPRSVEEISRFADTAANDLMIFKSLFIHIQSMIPDGWDYEIRLLSFNIEDGIDGRLIKLGANYICEFTVYNGKISVYNRVGAFVGTYKGINFAAKKIINILKLINLTEIIEK